MHRIHGKTVKSVATLGLMALGLVVRSAYGADLPVSDVQGLIDALGNAGNGDVIKLAAGVYDLTGVNKGNELSGWGAAQLGAKQPVSIVGEDDTSWRTAANRSTGAIIRGDKSQRIFVLGNPTAFRHVTFENGKDASGACFWAPIEGMVFSNCVFRGCEVTGLGGILNVTSPEVRDCLFEDNAVAGAPAICKGGTYSSCEIIRANAPGGSVLSDGALLYDCVVSNCVGTYGAALNGGVARRTLFANNQGTGGGALANADAFDCVFSNNVASAQGGAAFFTGGAYRMEGCTFFGNVANGWGGGGAIYGAHTSSNCVFFSNRATQSGGMGGAVNGGTVIDSVVAGNVSLANNGAAEGSGGGLFGVTAIDCVITNNSASTRGGGGLYGGSATRCLIADNTSTGHGAGAANAALVDCVVSNNVSDLEGGGIYLDAAVSGVSGTAICGNRVSGQFLAGGGVAATGAGSGVLITNCEIFANACLTGSAGGLSCAENVVGCRIHDNTNQFYSANAWHCKFRRCEFFGGGHACQCHFDGCEFHDTVDVNGTHGPVVSCANGADGWETVVVNCLFRNCGNEFLLNNQGSVLKAMNCTFAGNAVGAAIFRHDMYNTDCPTTEIVNCLCADNVKVGDPATDIGFAVSVTPILANDGPVLTVRNGLARSYAVPEDKGDVILSGNLVGNPGFCGPDNKWNAPRYSIRHSSKARDAGAEVDWPEGAVDLAGNPRVNGPAVDIGCYECWLEPSGLMVIFR